MRTGAKRKSTWGVWGVVLIAMTALLSWDISGTIAEKLRLIGIYGIDDDEWVVVEHEVPTAYLDPIEARAPAQNSEVGVCQSTDAELGGLAAALTDTLTFAQVDSITRLSVQRAGGLDAIVDPGDWVVIKPNILNFPQSYLFGYPDTMVIGTSTDLRVVKSLIQQLVEEGDASRITISEGGDWHNMDALPAALQGIQTEDGWTCYWPHYGNLSYTEMVADFDTLYPGIAFDIVDMNYPPYTAKPVPGGGLIGDTYTIPDVLDCDVFIPIATMKTHFISRITCMHKHYVGVAPAAVYASGAPPFNVNKGLLPHGDNIERTIIDLFSYHPADFSIVECFWGMEEFGPHQGIPIQRNVVLASRDPVALDAADAYVMGFNPWDIDHLHWSHNKGFGTYDLEYITVHGPDLDDVRYEFIKAPRGPGYYLGRGNRIWLVNGTYDGSTDLDAEQLGAGVEATISPVPGQMTQGHEWTIAQFTDVTEYCDLNAYYGGPSNCVSYAFTRIIVDTAQTAYLRFGVNEGSKIWLNGSVIYNQPSVGGGSDWSKVEDGVAINLTAGVNTLLLKISNASGGYGFSLFTTESSSDGDTPLGLEYRVTALPAPEVVLHAPLDDAIVADTFVELSASVTDGDADPLTVWIYGGDTPDASDLLYMAEGVSSGTHIAHTWDAPLLEVTPNTRGLWHLNENTGAAVADESGYGNTGTITGATWSTTGQFGPCLSFSGSPGDYLDVGDDPSLNPTDEMTFEAWINVRQVTGLGPKVCIRDSCYAMRVRSDGGLSWELGRSGPYTEVYANTPAGSVPIGEWTYVVGTVDTGGVMHAYINGELLGTNDLGGELRSAATDLYIGWWPDYHLDGYVDEVRVSDRALTAAEIQANYRLGSGTYYWRAIASDGSTADTTETRSFFIPTAGSDVLPPVITLNAPADGTQFPESTLVDLDFTVSDPESSPLEVWIYGDTSATPTTLLYHVSGLTGPAGVLYPWGSGESELAVTGNTVALWHFNENAGTTASDETGNHDGVVQSAVWAAGRFGSALTFGGDDRVEIPDSPDWNTPELTVQAWVNATTFSSTYNCVVTKGSYPTPIDLSWAMCVYDGQLILLVGNADGSTWAVSLDAMGGTTLSTDTWYHLAATYDGSDVRLYVNGVLDTNGTANPYAYSGGIHYAVGPVDIGSSLQQTTPDTWDGLIDEVRISDVALSESELQATYALEVGRYYWSVTASDSSANSSTSETRFFDIVRPDTLAPGITLNTPADGAQIVEGSTVVLDVTVVDPEFSPMEVWVYGDTSATPGTLLHHASDLTSPANILYTWGGGESEFTVTSNTVSLWHFNENAGIAATDETGNHDGVVQNATWAPGRFGSALTFGGDDRVEIADSPDWNTPQLTLQAWVYATAVAAGDYNCVLTKGTLPDAMNPRDLGYCLALHDGRPVFLMGNADGSDWAVVLDAVGATTMDTGVWNHVAVTYDGSYVRLYLNGVLDANGAANPYYYDGGLHFSVGPLDVGSSFQRDTNHSWDGFIDEIRISDVALSASELQTTYALEAGRYYWYVNAADTSGNDSASATRYFDVAPAVPPPGLPALLSPVDSALINTDTPGFAWSSTAGAGGTYTLEYALDAGFTAGVQTIAGITDTVHTPAEALADATYFWHVQAFNSIGDSSGYQATPLSFTVDAGAPAVPTLIHPPDLAVITDDTPTFDWSATAGPGGKYTLEYATDVVFTTGLVTVPDLADTTYTIPGLLPGGKGVVDGTYYWHVEAIDTATNASGYQTAPFSFTVDTEAPNVPTLILPLDLAVVDDNTPIFEWSGTAGSGGTYTLEFASDSDFTFVVTVGDIEDTVYEELTPFMDGDYYWHVNATDQAGHASGYQTTPFRFSVDLGVPPVPILVSPPDSSFTCDTTPVLTWIGSDPLLVGGLRTDAGSSGSGAASSSVTYTLQYSADPLFAQATTVVGIADATYTVPETGAMPYGTCYWRVEAVDEADHHSGYQADAFRFGVFVAGDQNQDSLTTSADVIYLVNFVFKGGATPQPCEAAGDSNCDGSVTSSDIIYQVNYVFKGGPPPCNVGALIADGTWSCP